MEHFFKPVNKSNKTQLQENKSKQKESKVNYERNSRRRSFLPSWKGQFPWVKNVKLEELYGEKGI